MKYRAIIPSLLLAASCLANAADCKPQTLIDITTIKPQAIVVGEVHGTEQIPNFVAGLVCSFVNAGRPVVLALERSAEEQAAIDRYIDSEGTAADRQALLSKGAWTWSIQDGRNSQAVLTLIDSIRLLRRAGQPVGILAMQQFPNPNLPKAAAQDRGPSNALLSRMNDRFMADMIATVMGMHPDHMIVALAHIAAPMYVEGNQIDAIAELGKIGASPPAVSAKK